MVDEVDKIVLSQLGKNARTSSLQIAHILKDMGYDITDRTIRHRLERLEKSNVILGYSAVLNPTFVSEKINRTVILNSSFQRIHRF